MNFLKSNRYRFNNFSIRNHSSKPPSSQFIRTQFLDFFIKNNSHTFVRSSSVIPFCDPTLSFCNAGMNQFKNILLGKQKSQYNRVANSQKCIRVGGKHNDLSIVGTDTYHHTFFEMLGNWSFGDYFKKEACEMSWKLLTDVYRIPPERLYVTYFKGDDILEIPADLECKEIWREIGVPENRIIGFGAKENFWEMGRTGPCGGCSEIHLDHLPTFKTINRSELVNKDRNDLTELWNIVFIEKMRHSDGSITTLPKKHIDTGMGFERLVAFLQGKHSNYDSDLFMPIFEKIHQVTKAPNYSGSFEGENRERDTAYRILADHSRMIAVSLADGMFPEQNHKLRRIIRKCINFSESEFKHPNLLPLTIPVVRQILGETFPELVKNMSFIDEITRYEQELYKSLRESMSKDVKEIIKKNPKLAELDIFNYPGFVLGYQDFCAYKKNNSSKEMSGDIMYQLNTNFGFDLELMERLAELEDMTTDKNGYLDKLEQMKKSYLDLHLTDDESIALDSLDYTTDNEIKYNYSYDNERQLYRIPPVKTKILSIFDKKGKIESTKNASNNVVKIIVEKSPFYYESGGQESDVGFIVKNHKHFQLKSVNNQGNFIVHSIETNPDEVLNVGDEVELNVGEENRSALIRNHSATHLLNAAIRDTTRVPIYQKSSVVNNQHLKYEVISFGPKIKSIDLESFENFIRKYIKDQPLERKVRIMNSQELQCEDKIVMVPGEIYPDDGIRLVTFGNVSKELCCGTHVFNTSELLDFTFLSMLSTGRNSYIFKAVTGSGAIKAIAIGDQLVNELENLRDTEISIQNIKEISSKLRDISIQLNNSNVDISFLKKLDCQVLTAEIKAVIKTESRKVLKELLEKEIKEAISESEEKFFIVHFLSCSDLMKGVSLDKATQYVNDRPLIIISYTDNIVKAVSCVPKHFISESFDANLWIKNITTIFNSHTSTPKGQNPKQITNMKEKFIHPEVFKNLVETALSAANKFAIENYYEKVQNSKANRIV